MPIEPDHFRGLYLPVEHPSYRSVTVFEDTRFSPLRPTTPRLIKTSPHHGRNVEWGDLMSRVIWSDEFGVHYGARGKKGLPLSEPRIIYDPYSPTKLAVLGYKDHIAALRLRQTSQLLLSQRFPTERIVKVEKLQEVKGPDGKMVDFEEWKKQALLNAKAIYNPANPEEFASEDDVKQYIKELQLYVIEREMQTSERLRDLGILMSGSINHRLLTHYMRKEFIDLQGFANVGNITMFAVERAKALYDAKAFSDLDYSPEQEKRVKKQIAFEIISTFKQLIDDPESERTIANYMPTLNTFERIINWINASETIRRKDDPSRSIDPIPPGLDGIINYLSFYLPTNMGANLGNLHRGSDEIPPMVHKYPSAHNWSAAGTLYDLDSVGIPKGNSEIDEKARMRDLQQSTYALLELFGMREMHVNRDSRNTTEDAPYADFIYSLLGSEEQAEKLTVYTVLYFIANYVKTFHFGNRELAIDEQAFVSEEARKLFITLHSY